MTGTLAYAMSASTNFHAAMPAAGLNADRQKALLKSLAADLGADDTPKHDIFKRIAASSMSDEKKNILAREVKNLHAAASRMQLRVGSDGFVDKHDLTEALKRTYGRRDQVELRASVRQRFLEHGLVVARHAD
jgi:methylphosphotriester-DNA--protein-cysteine methyltransferase